MRVNARRVTHPNGLVNRTDGAASLGEGRRAHADAEPGRQPGVGVRSAQVRQHQQRLPSGRQLPPPRPDHPPMLAQQTSGEPQRAAGQVNGSRVGQHLEAPGQMSRSWSRSHLPRASPHHRHRHTALTSKIGWKRLTVRPSHGGRRRGSRRTPWSYPGRPHPPPNSEPDGVVVGRRVPGQVAGESPGPFPIAGWGGGGCDAASVSESDFFVGGWAAFQMALNWSSK